MRASPVRPSVWTSATRRSADFARGEGIGLTVVGPEAALAAGIVDSFREAGLRIFGPTKAAARIESSKEFAKDLMARYGIPTAGYRAFTDYEAARAYVAARPFPAVLKYDGLAAGKGVVIAQTMEEADEALRQMLLDDKFGEGKVVVEDFLEGPEFSLLCFVSGRRVWPMGLSQDHKRAYDGDKGLNTGGMGTFTPCPFYDAAAEKEVMENILLPTMRAMNAEGRPFKGVLYFGLMRTNEGYKVVEYNARFGDPETQVVLPMLKTDILDIFEAVTDGRLSELKIEWEEGACVCVVLASGGYPEKYEKGKQIEIGALDEGILLAHAGTKRENGVLKTNGGRVLGVCAKGNTVEEAREKAYRNVEKISFEGMHYRRDIGVKYNKKG